MTTFCKQILRPSTRAAVRTYARQVFRRGELVPSSESFSDELSRSAIGLRRGRLWFDNPRSQDVDAMIKGLA